MDRITDKISIDQGNFYSTQLEEALIKNVDSIFDCTVVSDTSNRLNDTMIGHVELLYSKDETVLLSEINSFLADNFGCQLEKIFIVDKEHNLGVTGKVLKRNLRKTYEEMA